MDVAFHSIASGRKQNLYVIKYKMGEGDKNSKRKTFRAEFSGSPLLIQTIIFDHLNQVEIVI